MNGILCNSKIRKMQAILALLIAGVTVLLQFLYETSPLLVDASALNLADEACYSFVCIEVTLPIIQWLVRRTKAPTFRQTLCCFLLETVLTVVFQLVRLFFQTLSPAAFYDISRLPTALVCEIAMTIISTTLITGVVCVWLWKRPILATCLPVVLSCIVNPIVYECRERVRYAKDESGIWIEKMDYETAGCTFFVISLAVAVVCVLVTALLLKLRTRRKTVLTA